MFYREERRCMTIFFVVPLMHSQLVISENFRRSEIFDDTQIKSSLHYFFSGIIKNSSDTTSEAELFSVRRYYNEDVAIFFSHESTDNILNTLKIYQQSEHYDGH